jgi:hypothetical protein
VREPVINYLKACPLPEAAAAVERLTAIDPEAVRRAATLAGFAGALAAKPAPATAAAPGADGDPGDPTGATPTPPPASATGPATGDDQALASRVAPVLADDDATDARASIDPAATGSTPVTAPAVAAPAGPAAAVATGPASWLPRALLLGGLGILVAMIIRSAMRAGGGTT